MNEAVGATVLDALWEVGLAVGRALERRVVLAHGADLLAGQAARERRPLGKPATVSPDGVGERLQHPLHTPPTVDSTTAVADEKRIGHPEGL